MPLLYGMMTVLKGQKQVGCTVVVLCMQDRGRSNPLPDHVVGGEQRRQQQAAAEAALERRMAQHRQQEEGGWNETAARPALVSL